MPRAPLLAPSVLVLHAPGVALVAHGKEPGRPWLGPRAGLPGPWPMTVSFHE